MSDDGDVLSLQDFDDKLNACYSAGYHDGAFPQEPAYSSAFEATREALLKHDAALRARANVTPKENG